MATIMMVMDAQETAGSNKDTLAVEAHPNLLTGAIPLDLNAYQLRQ